jgi:hypothetical protein
MSMYVIKGGWDLDERVKDGGLCLGRDARAGVSYREEQTVRTRRGRDTEDTATATTTAIATATSTATVTITATALRVAQNHANSDGFPRGGKLYRVAERNLSHRGEEGVYYN